MQKIEPLEYSNFYHIYNRGINSCNLFEENTNYEYFLRLYEHHISPVANTYAWVLMKNHFHFLVRIKDKKEVMTFKPDRSIDLSGLSIPPPHQHFSNFFNAYSKAYNKRYKRHGSLFERPFKRKLVSNPEYLKQLVIYIHNNPVHHGFVENIIDYPWSSYLTCISEKSLRIQSNSVIEWFKDDIGFKNMHSTECNVELIDEWLGLQDLTGLKPVRSDLRKNPPENSPGTISPKPLSQRCRAI
jgi:putative transposase